MASGRFVSSRVCADKKINQLSDDTSRLAFTWLITFADCDGRTYGDPAVVCSMLFPRRRDITTEQMETYIREWASLGMIVWYENGGDAWIWFPNFEDNQPNLRKDREADSRIPAHNNEGSADLLRTQSGLTPDLLPVKLKEIKRNDKQATPAAVIPASLDCVEFKSAWNDWINYQIEKKHKLTPTTQKRQLASLGKFSPVTAIAMIDQSISAGWQGLFPLKSNGNGGSHPPALTQYQKTHAEKARLMKFPEPNEIEEAPRV